VTGHGFSGVLTAIDLLAQMVAIRR